MSKVPIWASPPPGTRKPRFTRDQIAAAAIDVVDREGFEALSMRRVAEALGAATMTLYYYVRTKDDLVALMDDALMAEVVARAEPLPTGWRSALEKIARATFATFHKHPWVMRVPNAAVMSPNTMRHIEQSLTAVAELPVPPAIRLELLSIVDDYAIGAIVRAGDPLPFDPRAARAMNELTTAQLRTGGYPHIAALVGKQEPVAAFMELAAVMTAETRFELGLAMLLDGLTMRYGLEPVAARRGPPRSRRRPVPASPTTVARAPAASRHRRHR